MWSKARRTEERVRVLEALYLFVSVMLFTNGCPLKWQWPVSNPIICIAGFCSSWLIVQLFFSRESFKKASSLFLSTNWVPILLMFSTHAVPDHLPGNHCIYTKCRLRARQRMWGALLADWLAISLPSIPLWPGTCYVLPVSLWSGDSTRLI